MTTDMQFSLALPGARPVPEASVLQVRGLDLQLQGRRILRGLSFDLPASGITTLIGPSGAGKSSLLRCLNGLQTQWTGQVQLAGRDVRNWPGGADALRRHVGLIAQKPCVFPCSVRANVAFGLRGFRQRRTAAGVVAASLRHAALWDEVAERLDMQAEQLSIGQQQRLCLARALAVRPGMLLLDEPTASLDPRSKQLIEHSLLALSGAMPMLCVTHDLDQARRLGGRVIFMCDGRIIEQGESAAFFNHPQRVASREFLRWNMCDCE